MKYIEWLIPEENFNFPEDHDWVIDVFIENGILSKEIGYIILEGIRQTNWDSPDCPFCRCDERHYPIRKNRWKCKKCRKQYSITTGTYIHNSKLAPHYWVRFSHLIGNIGLTNTSAIAKDLGLTQKTTWGMLKTLKKARKKTSKEPFKNGQEVLSFKNKYEILDSLLTVKVVTK